MVDYEEKFEKLRFMILHKNKGFTEEYFVSNYLSGLKDHIKTSVRMFRPRTLTDAVFLAKQEEAKTTKPQTTFKLPISTGNRDTPNFFRPEPKSGYSNYPSPLNKTSPQDIKKPRSTLSSREILEMRERGQCFHCDYSTRPKF